MQLQCTLIEWTPKFIYIFWLFLTKFFFFLIQRDRPFPMNVIMDKEASDASLSSLEESSSTSEKSSSIEEILSSMSVEVATSNAQNALLNLSWPDILMARILPLLSIEDVFNLRSCSSGFHCLVGHYFASARRLNLSTKKNITETAFKVIAKPGIIKQI